jgi:hypothetical protein
MVQTVINPVVGCAAMPSTSESAIYTRIQDCCSTHLVLTKSTLTHPLSAWRAVSPMCNIRAPSTIRTDRPVGVTHDACEGIEDCDLHS